MHSCESSFSDHLKLSPNDTCDKANNQATESDNMSRCGQSSLEQWTSSLSSSSLPSPSTSSEKQPSDLTFKFEHCTADTEVCEKCLLKQAFGSMVRERQWNSQEWRMLRQAELNEQARKDTETREQTRSRSLFGFTWSSY